MKQEPTVCMSLFSLIYPLGVNIEAAIYHRNQERGNSCLLEYRLLRDIDDKLAL